MINYKKNQKLRVFSTFCVLYLLAGCAKLPKESIAINAIDYNLAVEKAHNEILLLNIIRASQRRPMYFTGFSAMRGNITNSFQSGSLNIPFGNIGTGYNGAYSIAPSATHSFTPSYDFGVLDSQEFMRGIMTPVSIETINYYLNQGWPKELILELFIEKIEDSSTSLTLDNYPVNHKQFCDFRNYVMNCNVIAHKTPPTEVSHNIDSESATDLVKIVEAYKAGLRINNISEKNSNKSSDAFQLSTTEKNGYAISCSDLNKNTKTNFFPNDTSHNEDQEKNGKVYLRSPEAIIYYLGEVIRDQYDRLTPGNNSPATCSNVEVPAASRFFIVHRSSSDYTKAGVSVEYEGEKYFINKEEIPSTWENRSMQLLSLVSQLIALQKTNKEMPVTATVEVVGR